MTAAPVSAAVALAVLMAVAAAASAERRRVLSIVTQAARGASFEVFQGRLIFALILLGIVIGTSIALGFAPGSVLLPVTGAAACALGRGLLSGAGISVRGALALVTIGWAALAGVARWETLQVEVAQAAQTVLGPAPLVAPLRAAAVSLAAGLVGLAGGAIFLAGLPSLTGNDQPGPLDHLVRWGERALVGAAVAATAWGPSIGMLTRAPAQGEVLLRSSGSFGLTLAAVALLSLTEPIAARVPMSWVWVLGGISGALFAASMVSG